MILRGNITSGKIEHNLFYTGNGIIYAYYLLFFDFYYEPFI